MGKNIPNHFLFHLIIYSLDTYWTPRRFSIKKLLASTAETVDIQGVTVVGVQSFELWASWSQTTRATSCATPRLILNFDYRSNMAYRNFPLCATSYRSETLSLCSLGALRIALCFFLFSHCLLPPPAAATSESPHPD